MLCSHMLANLPRGAVETRAPYMRKWGVLRHAVETGSRWMVWYQTAETWPSIPVCLLERLFSELLNDMILPAALAF